ncbi:hypothetical protein IC619_005720 [Hazenella sp. IB182353]|uniref:hypothetical protein n=1 Tax=Polycladospora coralii TaxID=2771432 RepID=UPI001747B06F|nr:hypothetical protein [Polycladospora coralii]MBS7529994.1 hypothetical protein [Polycladospora coralii]
MQTRRNKWAQTVLTSYGWDQLYQWIEENPAYPIIRYKLIVKMIFAGADLHHETLFHHLKGRKKRTDRLSAQYQIWPQNGTSYISELSMYPIELA